MCRDVRLDPLEGLSTRHERELYVLYLWEQHAADNADAHAALRRIHDAMCDDSV
eukprot:m.414017 g.414017  ORF g.414017 m.414017 type:complete len:54 (-) comp21266_c0_seq30:2941-3102(-)